jgi:hypothetical protein
MQENDLDRTPDLGNLSPMPNTAAGPAMKDTELIERAFEKWSDHELAAGREPNASRFAKEMLLRDPRQLRRWRGGTADLPVMVREWCRQFLTE